MGYSTVPWASFGAALAAVAGALTGLLFVALSVMSDALAASGSLRARATQTLVLFVTSVLVAVLLVAPQPAAALGAELLAVAVVSGTCMLILDRRAGHGSDQEVARYIERFSPNTITAVFVGVAGLTFLVKAGGGLYWLIPAAMASLVGGVVTAWLFLVRPPASPNSPIMSLDERPATHALIWCSERARSARPAGLEPATRCLEGLFAQRVSLPVRR